MSQAEPILTQRHAAHLEQRGISPEIAVRHCVTVGGDLAFEYVYQDVLQYRKMFTWSDGRKIVRRDRQGAKTVLFNVDVLAGVSSHDDVIITEGEIDALSFMEIGAPYVVSVPDGAQLREPGQGEIVPQKDSTFAWLWTPDGKLLPGLRAARRVILATDDDDPGQVLREELAVRIGRSKCWFVTYPPECKDANDVLCHDGEHGLIKLLADSKPLIPNRLASISELPDTKPRRTYPVGMGLDDRIKLMPPELVVITGPPGDGKSQFAIAMAANCAAVHGWRIAYLGFEDAPERNIHDLHRFAAGRVPGVNSSAEARPWINEMFRFVLPNEDDEDVDLGWLKQTIFEAATRHDCKMVICDPWNEIEHMWQGSTQAAYLNGALRDLKKLARQLQIVVVICAHPDKASGLNNTDIDQWSMYAIDGGATWFNKADHGLIVFRPDKSGPFSWLKVDKCKDHLRMGTPGVVRLEYLGGSATFRATPRG